MRAATTPEGGPDGSEEGEPVAPPRNAGQPDAASYLGVGLTWTLSTLLFLWLGTKADGWLGTGPWLTLVGAFVGAAAGFYYMIHHLLVVPGRRKGAAPDAAGDPRTEKGPDDR